VDSANLPTGKIRVNQYYLLLELIRQSKNIPLKRYLSKKAMKRVKQDFLGQNGAQCLGSHCEKTINSCECNIMFHTDTEKFPHRVSQLIFRYKDGVKKTYPEMFEEFLHQISHKWCLHKGSIIPLEGDQQVLEALQTITMNVGPNQVPVPAPFEGSLPVQKQYVLNENILRPYREWDMIYYAKYYGIVKPEAWWREHIWKEIRENGKLYVGTPWKDEVKDLLINSMRIASFYNKAFAGVSIEGKLYKHNYFSQQDLYPKKLEKLLAKYNKFTHILPPLMRENKNILPLAIDMMVKDEEWDKMFETVEWSYEKAIKECIQIAVAAASGGRPGKEREPEEIRPGFYKHVTIKGKKHEQIFFVGKVFDEAVLVFFESGVWKLPPPYYKIVIKSEMQHAETITVEELEKISMKAREYFIPDLATIIQAQLVHGHRQKIERGKLIQIGKDWNKGGMEYFAKYFRYKDPEMRYITFDISAYDTSVLKVFLHIYSRWSKVYMKFKTKADKRLFEAMLNEATHRLATKVTQMVGNIWRVIDGVMPSGAFETSHGDSWITALVYYCMFAYYKTTDVEFRKRYNKLKAEGKVMLAVYGDDNVLGFHEDLSPWFTEKKNVTNFFFGFAGFTIRDFILHKQFLSEIDGRGGLKYKGVVFLQKYAVKTPAKFQGYVGMPSVVHYRPMEVNLKKFAKGSGDERTDLDYFLSTITGVYDNPFNQAWYDACAHMYKAFMQPEGWQKSVSEVLKKTQGNVTRTLRKANINPEVLKEGFPTVSMIVQLSLKDKEHHKNRKVDEWTVDLRNLGL